MARTISIRFGQGQGLEESADAYGTGLSELQNAELDLDDVVRKRDGALSVPLTRLDSILGVTAVQNPVGLWHRDRELCVENGERLYARRTCATEPVASVGAFVSRGPWTRGTMREIVGPQETADITSCVRLETSDGECALDAWVVNGVGLKYRISGAGIEEEAVLDADGVQVKGGMVSTSGQQGILAWHTSNPADTIRFAGWTPGSSGILPPSTVFNNVVPGDVDKQWDMYAEAELSGGFAVWAALTGTNQISVRARKSSTGAMSAILNLVPGLVSTVRHGCAIWVDPLAIGPDLYNVWVAASFESGSPRYVVAKLTYNVAANALALVSGPIANTAAMSIAARPIAVCASWQNSATVAHVAFGTSTIVLRNMTLGVGDVSVRSLPETAIVTGFRSMPAEDGKPWRNVIVLADLTDELLSSALFLVDPFLAGDGSLSGQTTGEIYARSWVAQCRTTLGNLVGLFSLVRSGDSLIYADSGRRTANGGILEQSCVSRWTLSTEPQRPALVGDYAVQAFGGYARLYDSAQTCEHDWHAAPVFSLSGIAGGALTSGALYTVAVSWRWTDATGRQHDGEPTIGTIVLAAGQGTIRVTLDILRWTERPGVVAAIWLSEPNRDVLYLHSAPFCAIDQITTTIATFATNLTTIADTSAEQLASDAVGGGPASITDFCAYGGGRLWGPSSRRENVIQHSTLPAEGLSPRWDVDALVEIPQRARAVLELEGRVVALGETVLTTFEGDGPSNVGAGAFFQRNVPARIGALRQHGAAVAPIGLLYASTRGPRLLDRGFVVRNVGARVSRVYEIEGETVRAAVYDPRRGTAVLLNEGSRAALLLHDDSARWGGEARGDVVDVACSQHGELAWLRSADVLVAEQVATYSPILSWLHASGGVVPAHLYAPRRMADYITGDALVAEGVPTPSIVAVTGAPGILGNRMMDTQNVQDQALRASDATIGNVLTSLAGAAFVRLDGTNSGGVCGKQNGVNEGWNVIHDVALGFIAQVADDAGVFVNVPLTLASSVVGEWRALVWVIDLATGELRFASDVEAGAPGALPPGIIEAVGIPLRIGDARLAPSTLRSLAGDTGGVALWRPADPASLDPLVLAQQLKTAWDSAAGIPTTRGVLDGPDSVQFALATPMFRVDDVTTHAGFRIVEAHLIGEYEGDHDLECELYRDYDEDAPVATYRVSALQVALNQYAGLPYAYRVPVGGLDSFRAAMLRVTDGAGGETASMRLARIDVAVEPAGGQQLEADVALDMGEA